MRLRIADSNIAPEQDLPVLGGYRAQAHPREPFRLPRRRASRGGRLSCQPSATTFWNVRRGLAFPAIGFHPSSSCRGLTPPSKRCSQEGGYDAGSRDRGCRLRWLSSHLGQFPLRSGTNLIARLFLKYPRTKREQCDDDRKQSARAVS